MLGILQLLTVPVFLAVFMGIASYQGASDLVAFPAFIVPVLVAAFSSLTIVAALKMKRLENYGLAIAASILAIISSPTNLIGSPIGIWALVVLSQRECGRRLHSIAGVGQGQMKGVQDRVTWYRRPLTMVCPIAGRSPSRPLACRFLRWSPL